MCMMIYYNITCGGSNFKAQTIWRSNFENFEAAAVGLQGPPAPVAKQSLGHQLFSIEILQK